MVHRFKRAAITLGTFLVLWSGTALAQEQLTKADLTQLVVTLSVYVNRCEKLATRLLADVQRMVLMLNKDDLSAGVIKEQDTVDRVRRSGVTRSGRWSILGFRMPRMPKTL